ncbi:MAG: response regulator transcription factor [Thermoflexales bacterium]|nr:response regulator transcription factor [Thermoflexales bacterium]
MRVLLVDDHAIFREGLTSLLTAHHIDIVGEAQDGFEAFEQARALRPDVILMDIQMPRCDGLTATRLIKAELPEIKIVMLTMAEDDANLFEAVKSGASGYLFKRANADEFLALFDDLAEGRAPFSPGLAAKVLAEFARLAGGARPIGPAPTPTPVEPVSLPGLTPRQVQVLTLIAQGHTYKAISDTLGLSERTIKYHMAEILERLHLDNRAQVIAFAVRRGLGRAP